MRKKQEQRETDFVVDGPQDEWTETGEWERGISEAERYHSTLPDMPAVSIADAEMYSATLPDMPGIRIDDTETPHQRWLDQTVQMEVVKVLPVQRITKSEAAVVSRYEEVLELIADLSFSVDGYPRPVVMEVVNNALDEFVDSNNVSVEDEAVLRPLVMMSLGVVRREFDHDEVGNKIPLGVVGDFVPSEGGKVRYYQQFHEQTGPKALDTEYVDIPVIGFRTEKSNLPTETIVSRNPSSLEDAALQVAEYLGFETAGIHVREIFARAIEAFFISRAQFINDKNVRPRLEQVFNTPGIRDLSLYEEFFNQIKPEEIELAAKVTAYQTENLQKSLSSDEAVKNFMEFVAVVSGREVKQDEVRRIVHYVFSEIVKLDDRSDLTVEMVEQWVNEGFELPAQEKQGGVLIAINNAYAWALNKVNDTNPMVRWVAAGTLAVLGAWLFSGGKYEAIKQEPVKQPGVVAKAPDSYLHRRSMIQDRAHEPIDVSPKTQAAPAPAAPNSKARVTARSKAQPKLKFSMKVRHEPLKPEKRDPVKEGIDSIKDPLLKDFLENRRLTAHAAGMGEMFLFAEMHGKVVDLVQSEIVKLPKNSPERDRLEKLLQSKKMRFDTLYKSYTNGWNGLFGVARDDQGKITRMISKHDGLSTTPSIDEARAFLKDNPQFDRNSDEARYLAHYFHLIRLQQDGKGNIAESNALDNEEINIVDKDQSFSVDSPKGLAGELCATGDLYKDATKAVFAMQHGNNKAKKSPAAAPMKKVEAPLPGMNPGQTFADADFGKQMQQDAASFMAANNEKRRDEGRRYRREPNVDVPVQRVDAPLPGMMPGQSFADASFASQTQSVLTPMTERRANEGMRYRPGMFDNMNSMAEKRENEGRRFREITSTTSAKVAEAIATPASVDAPASHDENLLSFCYTGELVAKSQQVKMLGAQIMGQEMLIEQLRKTTNSSPEFQARADKIEKLAESAQFELIDDDGINARLRINDVDLLGQIERAVREC